MHHQRGGGRRRGGAGLLALGLAFGLLAAAPLGAQGKKSPPDESEAEARFEAAREQFEKEKSLQDFERVPGIHKLGDAPCRKAAEFLRGLYESETNPGLRGAVSVALGKIGSEEAVKALVEVGIPLLVEDPAFADVLEALRRPLQSEAEEWLIKGGLTPAVRKSPDAFEAVLGAIARARSPNRLKALLAEARRVESPRLQAAVLHGLRSANDDRVRTLATSLIKSSKDAQVLIAAYDILADAAPARYRTQFVAGLKSDHWEVRVLSIDALSKLDDRDLVKLVGPLLKDPDPRAQVAAIQAFVKRAGPQVIGPLIGAMEGARGRVLDDISDALLRLTGKNFGPVAIQWDGWWSQVKSLGGEYKAISDAEFARLKEEDRNQATVLYYGLRVLSDYAAFCMDTSESMDEEYVPRAPAAGEDKDGGGPTTVVVKPPPAGGKKGKKGKAAAKPKGPTRLDIAKKELVQVVRGLKKGQSFDILRFDSIIADFALTQGAAETSLVPATPEAVAAAEAFVQAAKAAGLTNLLGVLKTALDYPEVDTIYLLSDGAPTVGVTDHAALLEEVSRLNRLRRVKIHVISFDPKDDERALLTALAARNGGLYVER